MESVRQRLHLLLLRHQDAVSQDRVAGREHSAELDKISRALVDLLKETEDLSTVLGQVMIFDQFSGS